MLYDWIIFDADNTLFDFNSSAEVALQEAFDERGLSYKHDYLSLYQGFNRQVWQAFEKGQISADQLKRERFAKLLAALAIEDDPEAFNDTYLERLAHGTKLIAGAQQVVQALALRTKLFMLTNGLKKVQRPRLSRSTIADYFQVFVVSEEVGVAKPDPHIFELVFQAMHHPAKDRVLMVGDSLTSDMQGALNYGIDNCWYNPDGSVQSQVKLRYEINDLHDLLKSPFF